MKIFLDTSALIALLVKQDQFHSLAVEHQLSLEKDQAQFFTSDYILDEIYTHVTYDFNQYFVEKVIKEIDRKIKNKELRVFPVDETTFLKAKGYLIKFAEHKASFTDCITYVLFKTLSIDELFTFDSDFKKLRLPVAP